MPSPLRYSITNAASSLFPQSTRMVSSPFWISVLSAWPTLMKCTTASLPGSVLISIGLLEAGKSNSLWIAPSPSCIPLKKSFVSWNIFCPILHPVWTTYRISFPVTPNNDRVNRRTATDRMILATRLVTRQSKEPARSAMMITRMVLWLSEI